MGRTAWAAVLLPDCPNYIGYLFVSRPNLREWGMGTVTVCEKEELPQQGRADTWGKTRVVYCEAWPKQPFQRHHIQQDLSHAEPLKEVQFILCWLCCFTWSIWRIKAQDSTQHHFFMMCSSVLSPWVQHWWARSPPFIISPTWKKNVFHFFHFKCKEYSSWLTCLN